MKAPVNTICDKRALKFKMKIATKPSKLRIKSRPNGKHYNLRNPQFLRVQKSRSAVLNLSTSLIAYFQNQIQNVPLEKLFMFLIISSSHFYILKNLSKNKKYKFSSQKQKYSLKKKNEER